MRSLDAIQIPVEIPVHDTTLQGQLELPLHAQGLVLFAHPDSGGRANPRNQRVADFLHDVDLGTLMIDLHAPGEASDAGYDTRSHSNLGALTRRLRDATHWARLQPETAELLLGYFGTGVSAGAVLAAAAAEGPGISAVVTRSGRLDLSDDTLKKLHSPTLLIVGGDDRAALAENLETWARLTGEKSLEIIPGVGPRFEEPGAADNVAALTARWFGEHLKKDLAL